MPKPTATGTPASALAAVGRIADGVIVGSRLVRAVGEAGSSGDAAIAVADFTASARAAMIAAA